MTTYPLDTLAPIVDTAGISAPSFNDILQSLIASAQSIFGSDIYLEPDSQDGQMIAVVADAINDSNNNAIATFNSYRPGSAQGAGLSSIVKINGLQREVASNSTVDVTIVGQAGTLITNGIVQDENNNQWALPASVTIPIGGTIDVTATCTVEGDVSAAASTVTSIVTPTRGWQTVNNAAAAVVGAPVEDDAELRVRQSVSTSLPAQSILGALIGAVANVPGVQDYAVYDNDTGSADGNGIPAHSISVVVQGGDSIAVATVIADKKTPGTGTYGTTTETIIDPAGIPNTIHFYHATQDEITVTVNITALGGYVSTTGDAIIQSIADTINAEGIYANSGKIYLTTLFAAAYATDFPKTYNVTGILLAISPGSPVAADLVIAFNAIPVCQTSDVTLNVS